MNQIKQVGLIAMATLAAAIPAQALIFDAGNPVQTGSQYSFNTKVTNNDLGAVYNSGMTDVLSDLISHNLSYGNSIQTIPDIFAGWSMIQNGTDLDFTHAPFGYTRWDNDINSNELSSNFTIANAELDTKVGNNNGTYEPFTLSDVTSPSWNPNNFDAIIVRTDNELLNLQNYTGSVTYNQMATFTAQDEGGFNSFFDSTQTYTVLKPSDFSVIPQCSIVSNGDGTLTVTFVGLLQFGNDLALLETIDPQPTSPYTFAPTGTGFFRAIQD